MLSKSVGNKMAGQETLGLMDIEVERNSYGRQSESFEADIKTELGLVHVVHAVFIRAPRITKTGTKCEVLAEHEGEIIACEQVSKAATTSPSPSTPNSRPPFFTNIFEENRFVTPPGIEPGFQA